MPTSTVPNRRPHLPTCIAGLLSLAAIVPLASAQGMRDLVEAAIDQQIMQRIEISERPIRDALAELEKPTGVHFALDSTALEWMPYGEQTRLSIVIEHMSVRRALERIFAGLGLALRIADNHVVVVPAPVLERLGRRLTVDEVTLLQTLAGQQWAHIRPDAFAVEFRLPPAGKSDPQQMFEEAMRAGPPADALTQLETVTQQMGCLWVPSGRNIVIYSRGEDIQQRLDRPLDLNYQRVALDALLVDLGRRIGITIHFEPGSLQRVAAQDRFVDLIQRDTTARQVLELISGRTGLWYEVGEHGVMVGARPSQGGSAPGGETRSPVVAIVRVPVGTDGTTIDFLIRADELPAEFKALRDRKMPEVIEILRKQLAQ